MNICPSSRTTYAAAMLSILMVGCGDGTSTEPDTGGAVESNFPVSAVFATPDGTPNTDLDDVRKVGYVSSSRYGVRAEFKQYRKVLTSDELREISSRGTGVTERGCTARRNSDPQLGAISFEFEGKLGDPLTISAGDAVSVMTPTGSMPDLLPLSNGDYYADYREFGELPSGSSIHIPGDTFPPFDSVSLPFVEPLEDVEFTQASGDQADRFDRLMPGSQITWSNVTTPGHFMRISFHMAQTLDNRVDDLVVYCVTEDDGEFSFPDWIQEILQDNHLLVSNIGIARVVRQTLRAGNALLWIDSNEHFNNR